MPEQKELENNKLAGGEYRYGFHTDIAEDKPLKFNTKNVTRDKIGSFWKRLFSRI